MPKKMTAKDAKLKNESLPPKLSFDLSLSPSGEQWVKILLCLTVLAAFIVRVLYLNQNPPAINQDEAMNGYNAFTLSKTLKDSRGFFLPVLMHGFGNADFRSPLYAYFSMPFVWIMGLSETSIRTPALIFNVALIPILYLFVNRLFNNKVVALLSAMFLAFNPWSIHYSRIGHEAVLSPFFYFVSIYLLYIALKDDRYNKLFPVIGAVFGLSMYSYQVARMLSPLLFGFVCLIFYKEALRKIKYLAYAVISACIVVFPMIYVSVINPGDLESRFAQVSILSLDNVIGSFILFYLTHFSPSFLFMEGDRWNMPGMYNQYGMFHWYIAPLFIIGLTYLVLNYRKTKQYGRETLLLMGFLLLYPLPAALTYPAPHALRAYTLFPVFHILAAAGAWCIARSIYSLNLNIKYKIASYIIFSIPIVYLAGTFLHNYYFVYPKFTANYYQYGMKEAVTYIAESQDKYDNIYFTSRSNQPFVYFLFYMKYDLMKYVNDIGKKADYKGFGNVSRFDKYNFVEEPSMPFNQEKSLFVTRPDTTNAPPNYVPKNKKLLKTIKGTRGEVLFYFWE